MKMIMNTMTASFVKQGVLSIEAGMIVCLACDFLSVYRSLLLRFQLVSQW